MLGYGVSGATVGLYVVIGGAGSGIGSICGELAGECFRVESCRLGNIMLEISVDVCSDRPSHCARAHGGPVKFNVL